MVVEDTITKLEVSPAGTVRVPCSCIQVFTFPFPALTVVGVEYWTLLPPLGAAWEEPMR